MTLQENEDQAIARTNCCRRLRNESKLENLWHSGNYPNTHGQLNYVLAFGSGGTAGLCCRSRRNARKFVAMTPWKWLAWRTFVFAYLLVILLYTLVVDWEDSGEWFYYLTHWQSIIFVLYGTSSLITCLLLRKHYSEVLFAKDFDESNRLLQERHEDKYKLPCYVSATWALHGVAMSCGLWVMILYWSAVSPTLATTSPINLLDHFSTIALVVIDFYFCAFPWLLLQFVWSTLFISVYTVWTGMHYALGLTNKFDGGRYIYAPIDWSTPVQTGFVVTVLILFALPWVNLVVWLASSEYMYCTYSPRRLVPWITDDGDDKPQIESTLVSVVVEQSV